MSKKPVEITKMVEVPEAEVLRDKKTIARLHGKLMKIHDYFRWQNKVSEFAVYIIWWFVELLAVYLVFMLAFVGWHSMQPMLGTTRTMIDLFLFGTSVLYLCRMIWGPFNTEAMNEIGRAAAVQFRKWSTRFRAVSELWVAIRNAQQMQAMRPKKYSGRRNQ